MINKKIILTTTLGALLASSTANAAIREFTYDGNDTYTFEGAKYNSLEDLFTFADKNINFEQDDLKLSDASARPFLNALKDSNSAERANLIKTFSVSGNISQADAKLGVDLVFGVINEVEKNGVDLLDLIDFNDVFEADLPELQELLAHAKGIVAATNNTNVVNAEFSDRATQLADANSTIKALLEERNQLLAIENKTAENNQKIADLEKQIFSSTDFDNLRKAATTQETLKQNIEQLKKALAANENSKLLAKGQEDLAQLQQSLSRYLVLNPTTSSDLPSVQQTDTVSESIVDLLTQNRELINSRISGFAGVASGDMMETYGVWAKGSFTKATQKAKGNSQGYKMDNKSLTIGLDTGDESLMGIAYSLSQSDVKGKSVSQNKDDITSHTISAYGKYVITPEIFVSAQGQFGVAQIKKKRATGDAANNIATAKPKASIIGANAEVGYNYAVMENVNVTPTVGFAYSDVTVKGYKESGNGLNREVGKISTSRTSATAGVSAQYFVEMGEMKVIPEIHANIDYALNTKNGNTVVTILDGIAPISTPSAKAEKARYNFGTSVKAIQSSAYEVSAGYDLGVAKKFQSHTGTLKLRVNL